MAENTPGIEVNRDPAARTSWAVQEGTLSISSRSGRVVHHMKIDESVSSNCPQLCTGTPLRRFQDLAHGDHDFARSMN
jgi:hypothetical protein